MNDSIQRVLNQFKLHKIIIKLEDNASNSGCYHA